jgi:hypothetical protein
MARDALDADQIRRIDVGEESRQRGAEHVPGVARGFLAAASDLPSLPIA